MASQLLSILSLLTLSFASLSSSQQQCTNPNQVRAGFWLSNSNHYFPLSNINTSLYTHLYYSSITIDYNQGLISLPPSDQVTYLINFSSTLKSTNPSLKTLISVTANGAFSNIVSDPNRRENFIDSTIKLAHENNFDGLDLSWQFPASSTDMANLAQLLTEWRSKINEEIQNSSSPLILTATFYFSNHIFDTLDQNLDYPIDSMSDNLDWVNILSFNLHKTTNVTVFDAPLYDRSSHSSVSYGIISWLDAGLSPCKIVFGIPLFGKTWVLRNKEKNELGSSVVASGPKQKASNMTGIIAFKEIRDIFKDSSVGISYDNKSVSSYLYTGNLWLCFDSSKVVSEKLEFGLRYRLLGYFLWPISFDDEKFSVSNLASQIWTNNNNSSPFDEGNGLGFGFDQSEAPFIFSPKKDHNSNPSKASGLKNNHIIFFILSFIMLI
ncbi:hypothetical protein LUZ60_007992 [Juncus effusus]|nr:hypothetical protein LUZ60_007992 [Juncus effusus]